MDTFVAVVGTLYLMGVTFNIRQKQYPFAVLNWIIAVWAALLPYNRIIQ